MWKNLSSTAVLIILSCGCQSRYNAAREHVIHASEHAQMLHSPRNPVCVAAAKKDVHLVARAAERGDELALSDLIREGRAFETDRSSAVVVEHEAFSERGVLIADGNEKGRRGWVPYEWLTPAGSAK